MNLFRSFLVVLFAVMFPISLYAADACTPSNYSHTMSTANLTDSHTVSLAKDQSMSYYISAASAGTLTITTNNSNNKIHLNGSENSCPASDASGVTSLSYSGNNSFDVNIVVFASNAATHTLTIEFTPIDAGCANPKEFTPVYSDNAYSKLALIGNTSLCANIGGVCGNPGTSTNNNINMMNNDYDDVLGVSDNASTTTNSSAAYLDIPAGKKVLWAGLFWQGYMVNWTEAQREAGRTIKYKHESDSSYNSITNAEMNWVFFDASRFYYQSFIDITSYVNSSGSGYYWVGDIATTTGQPTGGSYGAWSMAVVYEDYSEDFKNISVYHGYQALAGATDTANAITYASNNGCNTSNTGLGTSVSSTLSGFLTPKSGTVESSLIVFAGEGDIGLTGDSGYITDKSNTEHPLTNALNPATNIMNATISKDGATVTNGLPYYSPNSLGADIDTYSLDGILDNEQFSTTIRLTTSGDGYMPGMYALETQLYVPEFCYDYSYKQQGIYFTEENDGTQLPRIVGNVIPNEPIEAKFFIRNLVDSDIAVTNMLVDIYDINTSQATYVANSTKIAEVGDITPKNLVDGTDVNIGSDYINNINVGTVDSQEHFYIYYNLNPSTSNLNIPMSARARYNITVAGTTIPYQLVLGSNMPMCTDAGNAYNPNMETIFNVVHSDYYDYDLVGGTDRYYNLPTQVTKREGNFKVIAMDPANPDNLKPQSTSVAVELIDASAFHDTYASCNEIESSISERVQVFFDNNVTSVPFNQTAIQTAINNAVTSLTDSSDFYATARENVAFRVSYGLTNDGNDSLVQHEYNSATQEYKILNFTELVQDIGTCVQPVVYALNPTQTATQVATACGNAGTFITRKHYYACLECLFGKNTRFECSRDNFALRPEAFMIKIDDQDQLDPASQVRIADNVSGVVTPSTATNHLASGYDYQLEVDAVNHTDNTPSFGYTKGFGGLASDALEYVWSPPVALSGCNDENNVSHSFRVLNGSVDLNSSLDQVGEYVLQMKDTTWTRVDGDFSYMSHHVGPYYTATRDCVLDSDITQAVNYATGSAAPFTGCNITSDHDSSNASALKYRNYNLEFHPYKFIMDGIGASYGENNNSIPFIYMNNINLPLNESMSFHLNGPIIAAGENNVSLSNFVNNCYAKPVDLTLNKSAISGAVDYLWRFHNTDLPANDQNGTLINPADPDDPVTLTLGTNDFNQSNNGGVNTLLNLNFNREVNASVNPERLFFSTYDSNCSVIADCTMNADLIANKVADGSRNLDLNVTHLYGRTHASRQRYQGAGGPANIYFESYCFGTVGGNLCNRNFLPNGFASRRVDDVRWFWNENHDITNDGNVTIVLQKGGTNVDANDIVDADDNPNGNPSVTQITYDGSRGYPYKTTMQNGASPWLIYNESDAGATMNEFQVEFNNAGTWTGENETTTTTQDSNASITNRRIMW